MTAQLDPGQTSRSRSGAADAEALIKEARRRQHRRYLVAATTIVVVAGVMAAVQGHAANRHLVDARSERDARAHYAETVPRIAANSNTTLVMWPIVADGEYPTFTPSGGPPADVANLSTGHSASRMIPDIIGCDCQPYMVGIGRSLVYVGSSGITAIADDLMGAPRVLGTSQFFAPSAAPGRVWLVYFHHNQPGQSPVVVRSVLVTGGRAGPPVTLPGATYSLIYGTEAGFLLLTQHGLGTGLALWTPGSAPNPLPYAASFDLADAIAVNGRLVAYATGCRSVLTAATAVEPGTDYESCRILRVFDVVTRHLLSVRAPAGSAGWLPQNGFNVGNAISPGNEMLVAYAGIPPLRQGWARLYVVPLMASPRSVRAVPSSATPVYASTAWSANGLWLLYRGAGGRLWAYQVSTGKVRPSNTPCCQFGMIAFASQSR